MLPGIVKDFPVSFRNVSFRNAVPLSFMKGSQVFPLWHDMQPGLVGEKRDLDKESGIIVKAAVLQVSNGDHGAIGSFMEAAKPDGLFVSNLIGTDALSADERRGDFKAPDL